MGVMRPHPPHHGEEKSVLRFIFEILHRVVGYGTMIVAVIAMLAGINKDLEIQQIDQVRSWNAAVISPVVVCAAFAILVTFYMAKPQQEDRPYGKNVELSAAQSTISESAVIEAGDA